MTRLLLAATSAAALTVAAATTAEADTVRMDLQGAYGSNVGLLGPTALHLVETLNTISDGSLRVRFHEPNTFVPNLQSFDAVANGSLDAAWATPGFWTGKDIAFALVGAVPFGPRAGEYVAWLKFGGGRELWDELYESYNVKAIPCGVIPPESSGWFREPIDSLEDLEGIKMRFYGLGAEVMEKLGVSTQLIGGGEIFQALQLGTIDATEFSMPVMDLSYGFYQIAKHNYFPGWHQQSTINDLLISMNKWEEMDETQRAIVETACDATMMWQFANGESLQGPAMQELEEKGVTFHMWPDEILAQMEEKWLEVVEEKKAESEMFARMWASLSEFRAAYEPWKDMGYLD
jgi:TRAP-type mannitol/chloroaromatic compound transport system substrate-binding protein